MLHGPSHTLAGALFIALLAAIIGRWLAPLLLHRMNREFAHYRLMHLPERTRISWPVAIASSLFGTLSHLLLDATMHSDMAPLAPFSDANPLLAIIPVVHVYGITTALAVVGVLAHLIRAIMTRPSVHKRGNQVE